MPRSNRSGARRRHCTGWQIISWRGNIEVREPKIFICHSRLAVALSRPFQTFRAMAYAIIRSGGKQYRVSPGDTISVEKLEASAGDKVAFADVLLHAEGSNVTPGTPLISGAKVTGE